jgi:hypothetical protein
MSTAIPASRCAPGFLSLAMQRGRLALASRELEMDSVRRSMRLLCSLSKECDSFAATVLHLLSFRPNYGNRLQEVEYEIS